MAFAYRASRIVVVAAIVLAGSSIGGASAIAANGVQCDPSVPNVCGDGSNCTSDGVCELNQITVTASNSGGTTFAQFVGSGSTGLIGAMNTIVAPVIFVLAFLVFIWGVVKYFFFGGGDEGSRAEGRQFILWGLIGMVVLFSVWGLVNLLLSTLGLTPGS